MRISLSNRASWFSSAASSANFASPAKNSAQNLNASTLFCFCIDQEEACKD